MSSSTPHHSGGRPPKYFSPDERNAARQAQCREDQRRRRERKRAERLSHLRFSEDPNNHPDHVSNEVSHMQSSKAESINLLVHRTVRDASSLYYYRS